MTAIGTFNKTAPRIMETLMREFRLSEIDAAAIVGNFGYETGGFKSLQEIKPVVVGARGGWGLPQWTGARRVAFEAWARQKGLKFDSLEANVGYVVYELKGPEHAALAAVRSAQGLYDKTVAFERSYERAGVKNYDKRHAWAQKALHAYDGSDTLPVDLGAGTFAGGGAVIAAQQVGAPWWLVIILMLAVAGVAVFIGRTFMQKKAKPVELPPMGGVEQYAEMPAPRSGAGGATPGG